MTETSTPRVRLALIGAGVIGRVHLSRIAASDDAELRGNLSAADLAAISFCDALCDGLMHELARAVEAAHHD